MTDMLSRSRSVSVTQTAYQTSTNLLSFQSHVEDHDLDEENDRDQREKDE